MTCTKNVLGHVEQFLKLTPDMTGDFLALYVLRLNTWFSHDCVEVPSEAIWFSKNPSIQLVYNIYIICIHTQRSQPPVSPTRTYNFHGRLCIPRPPAEAMSRCWAW